MTRIRTTMTRRPWLAPLAGCGLAAILLFVPVSYQTTTGYDVRLDIQNPTGAPAEHGQLAADFAKALSTEHVALSISNGGGRTEILARVNDGDRATVETHARLFATVLSRRGLSSEISLAPVYSVTTSPVYAMGLERALRLDIRRQGRAASDVERDIKAQLLGSDISDAQVSYREKNGCSLIQIVMPGAGAAGAAHSVSGGGLHVALICAASDEVCKQKCADRSNCSATCSTSTKCTTNGNVQVSLDGQSGYVCSGEVNLESVAGLSDEQIAQAIRSGFESQGCRTDVVVRNGEVVSVDPECKKD